MRSSGAVLLVTLLASQAVGQTLLATLDGDGTFFNQDFNTWSVANVGDLDGDGRADWIVSSGDDPYGTKQFTRAFSSLDGRELWSVPFGSRAGRAGHHDFDGVPDVLVWGTFDGPVRVVSGATGAVLLQVPAPPYPACLGESASTASSAGDVNADGHTDLIVSDPCAEQDPFWDCCPKGRVMVLSGIDGSTLYEYVGQSKEQPLSAVASAGDVDGDGHDDFVVGTPGGLLHQLMLYSGASGGLLWQTDLGGGHYLTVFADGEMRPFPRDVDGDGVQELLVGASYKSFGGFSAAGRVYLISLASGATIWSWSGEANYEHLGDAVGTADVNGDGMPEVLATSWIDHEGAPFGGRLRAFSVTDGSVLMDVDDLAPPPSQFAHSTVADAGDFDGDGRDEVLTGSISIPANLWSPVDGPILTLQKALPPDDGLAPLLTATGTPAAGEEITVYLANGEPSAAAQLVLGVQQLFASFKGGTLVPSVDVLVGPLVTDQDGGFQLVATWPSGVPAGTSVLLQLWLPATPSPGGWTASNGLSITASP